MLFKPELCKAIAAGAKNQTRRIVKAGERSMPFTPELNPDIYAVYDTKDRLKWMVGRTYTIQPGRGKHTAMYHPSTQHVEINPVVFGWNLEYDCRELQSDYRSAFAKRGYIPLAIRILAIEHQEIQDITEADALMEGVTYSGVNFEPGSHRDNFRQLWDSINTKKAIRWGANPAVWVIRFELAGQ